jgi:hypothetical protein
MRSRQRKRATAMAAIAGLLLVSSSAAAAPAAAPPPVFEGTWIATVGPQVFHGRWVAQAIPGQPDDVQGSFSMVNDAGETVGKGTWSAQRAKRGFQGKWSARGANGGTYNGSFEAHLPGFKGKTLEDMFAETRTKQISGFFRTSGGVRGAWYFKGPAQK